MDILKISYNSIKVMLDAKDMEAYSLCYYDLLNDTGYSVEIIREIIRKAGEECGFESEGHKFFVQLYTSESECEIFVKRLECSSAASLETTEKPREVQTVTVSKSHGVFVYSFFEMSLMIGACKRLQTANYSGNSAAYKEDGGRMYYLILEERSPLPEEHGGKLCTKGTAYYINEHCRLICRDAVRSLGDLA